MQFYEEGEYEKVWRQTVIETFPGAFEIKKILRERQN
jgi:hypothetical protein